MKLFSFSVFLVVSVLIADAHPLKMAYTAVKYNKEKKVFEIGHRVFQDDFEKTLNGKYNYSEDVYVNQHSADAQKAVNQFFSNNFSTRSKPNIAYNAS